MNQTDQEKLIEGSKIEAVPVTVRTGTQGGSDPAPGDTSAGGQGITAEHPASNTTAATPASQPGDGASSQTTFRVGTKEFRSKAEADAYVLALEMTHAQSLQFQDLTKRVENLGKKPEDPFLVDGKKIEDVWFDDPRKAAEHLFKAATEEAEKRIEAKNSKARQQIEFWDSFYKENPDLKVADKFVRLEFSQVLEREPNLSFEDARKKLANTVRGELQVVLQANGVKKTELPKNTQSTIAPSFADGSTGNTQRSEKVLSFSDQIKQDRQRRKSS